MATAHAAEEIDALVRHVPCSPHDRPDHLDRETVPQDGAAYGVLVDPVRADIPRARHDGVLDRHL